MQEKSKVELRIADFSSMRFFQVYSLTIWLNVNGETISRVHDFMFLKRLWRTAQVYVEIQSEIAHYKLPFPNIRPALIRYLLYEAWSRPVKSKHEDITDQDYSPQLHYHIGWYHPKLWGYHLLLAYDDGVDQYPTTQASLYEHLFRCIFGLLVGASGGLPQTGGQFSSHLVSLRRQICSAFINRPTVVNEIMSHLEQSSFVQSSCQHGLANYENLFIYSFCKEHNQKLNVPIAASLELGKNLCAIYNLIKSDTESKQNSTWHWEFIVKSLIISGYAQVRTTSFETKSTISYPYSWKECVEIACNKSNTYMEIVACYHNVLDQGLLRRRLEHSSQLCYQFIDDVEDFMVDTCIGQAGMIHIFMQEQGSIAHRLLPYAEQLTETPIRFARLVQDIINDSGILVSHYGKVFVFQNAIVQSQRKAQSNIDVNSDIEGIIRACLTNSPRELHLPLYSLILKRSSEYEKYNYFWSSGNFLMCAKIILYSSVATMMIDGYIHFVKEQKPVLVDKLSLHSHYYMLLILLYRGRLSFFLQCQRLWLADTIRNCTRHGRQRT